MAPDEKPNLWSLPQFYFSVEIPSIGAKLAFQEVSGLEVETQTIDYRSGNQSNFNAIKMPGLVKSNNVTLKRGVFEADNKFWDWFNEIKLNTISRASVTISLLDSEANPTMVWTLRNAWPTKISGTDLKPESSEVAVEEIVLAHEGIAVAHG